MPNESRGQKGELAMTEVALFDVVIPGVIAWVLVDDLIRSIKTSENFQPVVNKLIEKKTSIKAAVSCASEPCSLRR